ncbi:MAG TPA: hypothetical protein VEU62_21905 [Bryobacterales bacterium]|nr:hypothetical protein [Bryobacterales bacterium]
MECPRCGALIAEVDGRPARCACGWAPAGALSSSLKLLLPGLLLDFTGMLLIVYTVVSAHGYVTVGVVLMAAGTALLVVGARRIAAASQIRKEPKP